MIKKTLFVNFICKVLNYWFSLFQQHPLLPRHHQMHGRQNIRFALNNPFCVSDRNQRSQARRRPHENSSGSVCRPTIERISFNFPNNCINCGFYFAVNYDSGHSNKSGFLQRYCLQCCRRGEPNVCFAVSFGNVLASWQTRHNRQCPSQLLYVCNYWQNLHEIK